MTKEPIQSIEYKMSSQKLAGWLFVVLFSFAPLAHSTSPIADTNCQLELLSDAFVVEVLNQRRPSDDVHIKYELIQIEQLKYSPSITSAQAWRTLLESGFNEQRATARRAFQELKNHNLQGYANSPTRDTHSHLLEENYSVLLNYLRAKGYRVLTVVDVKYSTVLKSNESGLSIQEKKIFRVPALVILPRESAFDVRYSQVTIYSQIVSGVSIDPATNFRYVGMDAIIQGALENQPTIDFGRNMKMN